MIVAILILVVLNFVYSCIIAYLILKPNRRVTQTFVRPIIDRDDVGVPVQTKTISGRVIPLTDEWESKKGDEYKNFANR